MSSSVEIQESGSAANSVRPDCCKRMIVVEKEAPGVLELVVPLAVRVSAFLLRQRLIEPDFCDKIQLCLTEALRNAVKHGNRCDFDKKIRLRVFVDKAEWGLLIEDEGEGFDPQALRSPVEGRDLWAESGRGIHIIKHYMDRVDHFSGGTALLMAKNR